MDRHYDGNDPLEPIPDSHFSDEERADARRLGDGSPAVEPRQPESGDSTDKADSTPPDEAQTDIKTA